MYLYIFMILIMIFLLFFHVKGINSEKKLAVIMIILCVICSLRSIMIGNDTITYSEIFNYISEYHDFSVYMSRYEYGFLYLNQLIGYFTSDFRIFLIITNSVIYYLYYRFIRKYSDNAVLSVLLFFLLGFFGQTMSIIRLQMAIVLCTLAFDFDHEDKKSKCLLTILIASSFQRLSLAFLVIYFIPKKINIKYLLVASVLLFVLYLNLNDIVLIISNVFPYFSIYLNSSIYVFGEVKFATTLELIIQISVFLFALLIFKNIQSMNIEKYRILCRLIYMIFISICITVLSMKFNLLDRVADLFWIYSIVLLPNVLSVFKVFDKKNIIAKSILISLSAIYFFTITIVKKEWNNIYPYKTYQVDDIDIP